MAELALEGLLEKDKKGAKGKRAGGGARGADDDENFINDEGMNDEEDEFLNKEFNDANDEGDGTLDDENFDS